ncbi:AAA family ATPase, partial [Bacteroides sp.]
FVPFSTPEALYWKVSAWLAERVCHILPKDNFTIDTVLEKARELVHRRGIRVLVIDPLNRLEHVIPPGQTETQYLSSLLNRLSGFAVRHRCLVVLVAHPRKMNRNPVTGITPRPDLYDINGSAEFFNKCDFGLAVHRDKDAGIVRVHVDKVKFKHLGQPGEATFVYDVVNGRYLPCSVSGGSEPQVTNTQFDSSCWLLEEVVEQGLRFS